MDKRLTAFTITRHYEAAADQEAVNFSGTLRQFDKTMFCYDYYDWSFFADEFIVDDGPDYAESKPAVVWENVFVEVTGGGETSAPGARTFAVYDAQGTPLIDFDRDYEDDCLITIVRGRPAAEHESRVVAPREPRLYGTGDCDTCGLDGCVCHVLTGTPAEHADALRSILGTLWDRDTHDWRELDSCADAVEAISSAVSQVSNDPEEICPVCNNEPQDETCGNCAGSGSVPVGGGR